MTGTTQPQKTILGCRYGQVASLRDIHHPKGAAMKLVWTFLVVCFAMSLTAWSTDPYKKYVGLWEGEVTDHFFGGKQTSVIEIVKQGESYLFSENALIKSDPVLLTKSNGQLSLNLGLAAMTIGFGENKDTLIINSDHYKRITPQRLAQVKEEARKAREAEEARRKAEEAKREAEWAEERAKLQAETERREAELAKERAHYARCKKLADDLRSKRQEEFHQIDERNDIEGKQREALKDGIRAKYKEMSTQQGCGEWL